MARVTWKEPYENVKGKFNKNSNLVHSVNAYVGQLAVRVSKRNLTLNPYTPDETTAKTLFTTRAKNVAARIKSDSATYAADIKAFMAQKAQPGGIQRFKAWLWADEMSK